MPKKLKRLETEVLEAINFASSVVHRLFWRFVLSEGRHALSCWDRFDGGIAIV